MLVVDETHNSRTAPTFVVRRQIRELGARVYQSDPY